MTNQMTNQIPCNAANTAERRVNAEVIKNTLKKVFRRILTYIPAAIIILLIALYYISLSRLGPV